MKPGRCLLGENCGYITSDSLLPLSLCMSLPVDGVFAASQAYWKMARKLKRTRFFFGGGGFGSAYDEALCFLDVFAVVETSSLTATLCLIWRDSYVEAVTVEKSRCLCNTSVLSDEINSTVKVSCWQAADGQEKTRSIHANFETFLSTWRTVETNPQTRVNAPFAATLKEDRYDQTTCTSNLLNHLSVFLCDTVSFVTRLMWGKILITAQLGRDDKRFYRRLHKKTLSYK